jgi:hypothetical protein
MVLRLLWVVWGGRVQSVAAGADNVCGVTDLARWMTSAPGAFVTMRPGGPFDGSVAISVGSERRLLVEATWKNDGEPRTASRSIEGYAAARDLAHDWADKLAAGREPETT